jgi:two-component system LytT family response regulator
MTIRAAIVDDEPLARRRIRNLLMEAPDVEVIAECANGKDAIEFLEESPPDLLFLDIQMPEIDGFDVLQAIGVGHVPVVIFVTAYDQFAMRAFEVSAVDYLLKPFTAERLAAALARARQQLSSRGERTVDARLAALLETIAGRSVPPRRMALKLEGRTVLVATDDIDYVEAAGNYVRVIVGREAHIVRERLSQMEATLDPGTFVRIHRSTVLNVNRIREMQPLFNGDQSIVLHNGTRLTLSRTYRDRLFSLLDLEGQRSQTTGGSGPDPGP